MLEYNLTKRQRQIISELVGAYQRGHQEEFLWLPELGSEPSIEIAGMAVRADETDLLVLQVEGLVLLRRLRYGWAGSLRQRAIDAVTPGFTRPEPPWTIRPNGISQVFLSYAREDSDSAQRLFHDLRERGVVVWFDQDALCGGERWKDAISQAISNSRFFIALSSTRSASKKGYVQKEIREALEVLNEFPDGGVFVTPVRLDDCRPSQLILNDLNWVDLFPSWAEGVQKIVRAVTKNTSTNL